MRVIQLRHEEQVCTQLLSMLLEALEAYKSGTQPKRVVFALCLARAGATTFPMPSTAGCAHSQETGVHWRCNQPILRRQHVLCQTAHISAFQTQVCKKTLAFHGVRVNGTEATLEFERTFDS